MPYYSPKNKESGFTLVELLIAMTIGLIILTALSSTFLMQRKIYDVQEQIVEMVQTARAAMDMMSREIRMAGYNPAGATFDGITYNAGQLQIRSDLDGDKNITGQENIIYIYDGTDFQIDRNIGSGDQPFAENIQSFTFDYLEADGVTKVTTTADNNKIRQIKITIKARSAKPDAGYGGYRTHTLTSLITPRNLGL
ncbi:MAG: prepilin-type N-terminal cleavage/methylation domain-containing protein [Thermodesulfobacteriota bacterium]|nr:prepilin-type N-terminal cleavage/methylation domain-containing protein [Thermodesulfobacteriota bacterium]